MTYKNVTAQNFGGTYYEFTTDEGLKGFIAITEIPDDKIKAHNYLVDLIEANIIIQYPEGKYFQKCLLSKFLLIHQESDAIKMLIENNFTSYQIHQKNTIP